MRRSALLVGGVVGGLIAGLPGTAAAAPSEHERFEFGGTEIFADFCGTGEDVVHTVTGHAIDFLSPANAEFAVVLHGTETLTFDGTAVTGHFEERAVFTIVEGVEEGPHVEEFTVSGMPSHFRLDGRTVIKDVGRITFRTTFDVDEEGNNLISSEISFLAGPHPDAEGGLQQFCDLMTEALGIDAG